MDKEVKSFSLAQIWPIFVALFYIIFSIWFVKVEIDFTSISESRIKWFFSQKIIKKIDVSN